MQADLIIVGAGMVGSALALALEHSGLEILVVDGGPLSVRPFADPAPTRVVALAWRKSFPRRRVIDLLAEAIRACPLGEAVRLSEPA